MLKLEVEFFNVKEKSPEDDSNVIAVWVYSAYASTRECTFRKKRFEFPGSKEMAVPDYWAYKPKYSSLFVKFNVD